MIFVKQISMGESSFRWPKEGCYEKSIPSASKISSSTSSRVSSSSALANVPIVKAISRITVKMYCILWFEIRLLNEWSQHERIVFILSLTNLIWPRWICCKQFKIQMRSRRCFHVCTVKFDIYIYIDRSTNRYQIFKFSLYWISPVQMAALCKDRQNSETSTYSIWTIEIEIRYT